MAGLSVASCLTVPRHGIDLAVVDGALDVSTTRRTPILDLFRTAIADHAALLVGWLTDAPVTCWRTGCGAEAVTVRLAGEAACSEQAQ